MFPKLGLAKQQLCYKHVIMCAIYTYQIINYKESCGQEKV